MLRRSIRLTILLILYLASPSTCLLTKRSFRIVSSISSITSTSRFSSKNDNDNGNNDVRSFYNYNDDAFGLISLTGGVVTNDVIFGGIFVTLSLLGAVGTRAKLLPRDPKRSTIVDRKVPGVIAGLTLLLSSPLTNLKDSIVAAGSSSNEFVSFLTNIPPPASYAQMVQFIICTFSIATTFLDIRWRDRFDYPQEFRDK